jgi:hypothetical protein
VNECKEKREHKGNRRDTYSSNLVYFFAHQLIDRNSKKVYSLEYISDIATIISYFLFSIRMKHILGYYIVTRNCVSQEYKNP